jgi:hypothetical protein
VFIKHIVKSGDMGIAEAGSLGCLLEETAAVSGIGAEVGSEALKGDEAFERSVFRAIDFAHGTFA